MANCQKCIDINTASVEELQTLPGIGHCRAEAIVQARTVSISVVSRQVQSSLAADLSSTICSIDPNYEIHTVSYYSLMLETLCVNNCKLKLKVEL